MKRVFLLVFVLSVIVLTSSAQSIKGVVVDAENQPLTGVNISIDNSFLGTYSHADGSFKLKLKSGKYTAEFSFLGYQSVRKSFDISTQDVVMNVTMKPQALVTEDVLVQATRVGEQMPVTYQDISGEELEKRKIVQDIPYLIQLTPSVVATSETGTGIGYTSFRIRGTDPTRVNVTIDGIPYNDAESQGTYWVNMPDFAGSLSSVQIQRGVGTSTNGAGAFGATMNFKTKALQTEPYAQIHASTGSFNTLKASAMAGTGLMKKHFTMDARFSRVLSDGFIDRGFVNHQSFQLSGAYRDEKSLLKATVIHGVQETGITWWGVPPDSLKNNPQFNPAGLFVDQNGNLNAYNGQTDNYIQTHYHLHYTFLFSNSLNFNLSAHYTRGDGYYEQYKDVEYEMIYGFQDLTDMSYSYYQLPDFVVGDSIITHTDLIRRKWMANDFYGAIFSLNYAKSKMDISFGGGWNQYDGNHFGRIIWMRYAANTEKEHEYYFNNGLKTDANTYVKMNYAMSENLNIYGDMQYRHINYVMSGKDDNLLPNGEQIDLSQSHVFDFLNPKAGLFYQIKNNMNLYVSFAIGHREPTRAHFKDAAGDENHFPVYETMYDYELGYQFQADKLAMGVNLYYMDYDNQLVPTGEKNAVGYNIMTNVEDSYRRGIELLAGLKISDKFDWNINFTFSQNKIRNFKYWASYYDADWNETYESRTINETDIAYSPSIIGTSRLEYEPISNLNFSIISKYVGKQYFDNLSSDDRSLDPYFVHNFEMSYLLTSQKFSEILFSFQINNFTNLKYSSDAYGGIWYEQGKEQTWAYYFPQAGIHFMAGVSLKF
jgi:iron complex outermembrane recepter protein